MGWSDDIYIVGIPSALAFMYASWRSRRNAPWLTLALIVDAVCGAIVLGTLLWAAVSNSGDEPPLLRYVRVVAGFVVVLLLVLTLKPVGSESHRRNGFS